MHDVVITWERVLTLSAQTTMSVRQLAESLGSIGVTIVSGDEASDTVRIVREWLRGRSCTHAGKPWQCEECTAAMVAALPPSAIPPDRDSHCVR